MSYGYVYVAHVAMGADYNQCIKAITEAESYNGPSIIIAYAPCINHGIKGGMGIAQAEEKKAVEAGYWQQLPLRPQHSLTQARIRSTSTARRQPPATVTSSWVRFVTTL